jgi:hypothetical protein
MSRERRDVRPSDAAHSMGLARCCGQSCRSVASDFFYAGDQKLLALHPLKTRAPASRVVVLIGSPLKSRERHV